MKTVKTMIKCRGCDSNNVYSYMENIPFTNLYGDNDQHIYTYYRCKDCHTIFIAPLPPKGEIENLYKNPQYYLSWEKDYVKNSKIRFRDDQKKKKVFLHKIKEEYRGGKILDLGCALGHFLYWMAPYFSELHGIEYSDFVVKNIVSSNIHIYTSFFNQFPDNYFDVITSWDVLEHTMNPIEILNEVYRVLKPGGKFLFTIPNGDSFTFSVSKEKWYQVVAPEHLTFFGKKAIQKRLKDIGFSNITISCSSRHFINPPIGLYPLITNLLGIKQNQKRVIESDQQRHGQGSKRIDKKIMYLSYFILVKLISYPINYFGRGDSLCTVAEKVDNDGKI